MDSFHTHYPNISKLYRGPPPPKPHILDPEGRVFKVAIAATMDGQVLPLLVDPVDRGFYKKGNSILRIHFYSVDGDTVTQKLH